MRLLLIFLLPVFHGYAQIASDTSYFDRQWKKCSVDSFVYFRLLKKVPDGYQVTDYYKSGAKQMTGLLSSLHPEIKNGFFTYFFESGITSSEQEYYNNQKRGTCRWYRDTLGTLRLTTQYSNDVKNGYSRSYLSDGKTIKIEYFYKQGKVIRSLSDEKINTDSIAKLYLRKDAHNDWADLKELIKKNFEENADITTYHISGKVNVTFDMDENNRISGIQILHSDDQKLNAFVIDGIKAKTIWQNPLPSNSTFTELIHYSVTVVFPQIDVTLSKKQNTVPAKK